MNHMKTNSLVIGYFHLLCMHCIFPCISTTVNGKYFEYSEILQLNSLCHSREKICNYRGLQRW